MKGILFSLAISLALFHFSPTYTVIAPALTVGSLAKITHSTPEIIPTPETHPPPTL